MSHFTFTKMALFLLLNAATMLVVGASSSLARFQSIPAFHNKINNRSNGGGIDISAALSSHDHCITKTLAIRCGAQDGDENEVEDDDAVDTDGESSDEEGESEVDFSDDSSDDSSDEDDYYDDVTEEEEEEDSELASQLKKKSSISGSTETGSETFVEPYFVSPSLQMYTTFGTILLSRKIDMFNPKIVRLTRCVLL